MNTLKWHIGFGKIISQNWRNMDFCRSLFHAQTFEKQFARCIFITDLIVVQVFITDLNAALAAFRSVINTQHGSPSRSLGLNFWLSSGFYIPQNISRAQEWIRKFVKVKLYHAFAKNSLGFLKLHSLLALRSLNNRELTSVLSQSP